MKSHGSGMIRLACRSGSVLPGRSGNVNVNPLRIVVKAGADGSRADRESYSQESATAGGSSQLSSSRLVRCPCHGLHFLRVAESTQRYTHIRRAPCSPAVRERWAHCHPFPTLPLCRAGATRGQAHADARSVPEYPLPVARRAADFPHSGACGRGATRRQRVDGPCLTQVSCGRWCIVWTSLDKRGS
jgi:hypothetical protein